MKKSKILFRLYALVGLLLSLSPVMAIEESLGKEKSSSQHSKAQIHPSRPNIIYILTDDLGYGDVGVFFQNSRKMTNDRSKPWHMTPNLDRFVSEGAQLTHHYCAAPVCAPSRASTLLGVSQGHANIRDNQFDKALENNHTLATVLKQAGYATIAIGKWGMQGKDKDQIDPATWPAFPTKRGFDHFFGYARHADGHEHYPKEAPYVMVRTANALAKSKNTTQNSHIEHKSMAVWNGTTNVTPDLDKCYTADLWTAYAKKWIVDHNAKQTDQPFFMFLAYDTPHAVLQLPTQAYPSGGGLKGGLEWVGKPGRMINTASGNIDSYYYPEYGNATYVIDRSAVGSPEVPWPDVYKRYATVVRRIDDAVGDIQKLLKDLNIDNDTLVIFTSDNGASMESYLQEKLKANFFESFGPFDGIKRDLLEGGTRVATLVRWPGYIPAGKIISTPSINYDWLPTFSQIAGIAPPARADGISILPELTGQSPIRERGPLYMEYYNDSRTPTYDEFTTNNRNRLRRQMQAIRIGDYIGVRYDIQSHKESFEIYNVTLDTKQTRNLATALPELEQKMRKMVLQMRRPDSEAPRPYDQQLVSASEPGAVVAGVEWRAFEGDFPWVPQFETLQQVASGTASQPDLNELPLKKNGGLFITGFLKIPQDGDYTFHLTTDSGALLRLHEATVIDADFGYTAGKEISGSIRLMAGLHPFRLYYVRKPSATGPAQMNFQWSGPGIDRQTVPAAVLVREAK